MRWLLLGLREVISQRHTQPALNISYRRLRTDRSARPRMKRRPCDTSRKRRA
jgi:hypothetical protein